MRIVAVDSIPYALPFERRYVTARGSLERRELVLVRLRTDEGIEGLGEAVALSLRGGADLASIQREVRELAAPQLLGSDLEREGCTGPTPRGLGNEVAAAIETALLDLGAKQAELPAWKLLGGESGDPVACNATLTAGLPDAVARDAEAWAARGFSTFKLKVGVPGDVAQVKAVRESVGAEARIRVDANGVWPAQEALERLGAMERFGLELAEQPSGDLQDLRLVSQGTAIPIAADESIASTRDAERAVELGACDLAAVKLAKVGGFAAAESIARLLPVYLSSALEGPVGIAAAAHAAQALSRGAIRTGVAHGLATQLLFADTIASMECEVLEGYLHLPEGPGLGVEIDERALERRRLH
jgi:L-alanine-DL-glutamate epimerase-like enolase superfamily enzyme